MYLGHNQISDVSPLLELPALTYFDLDGNPVCCRYPDAALEALKEREIPHHVCAACN